MGGQGAHLDGRGPGWHPRMGEVGRELSGLFNKGANPFHEGASLVTESPPQCPPRSMITPGIRISTRECGGDASAQITAARAQGAAV